MPYGGTRNRDNREQKTEEIAKRFEAPREFIEASQSLRQATTMQAKLAVFSKEKALIEQGDLEAVKRQHDRGKLTARERVTRGAFSIIM